VLEVGRTNDPQYIPLLLSLFDSSIYPARNAARSALAKLGDRKALQYFACRSLTSDVDKMQLLMQSELDYIGGGFTIEIYRQLLNSDSRFLPEIKRNGAHKYLNVLYSYVTEQDGTL
jgi:HEAT repeat protein